MKKVPTAVEVFHDKYTWDLSVKTHIVHNKSIHNVIQCYSIIKLNPVDSLIQQCNANKLQTTIEFLLCNYPGMKNFKQCMFDHLLWGEFQIYWL
jgi:hypothetical protein